MLFENNPKIGARFFETPLGVLKEGAAADIIVMDYKPFTPFSGDNIDGHMLFGMTGRQCETTMCNGKLLMKDRQLVGIDEEEINRGITELSGKLWQDINA
jgi:cytosine/adenosine deaminase-related metal-dependent hydrolase